LFINILVKDDDDAMEIPFSFYLYFFFTQFLRLFSPLGELLFAQKVTKSAGLLPP